MLDSVHCQLMTWWKVELSRLLNAVDCFQIIVHWASLMKLISLCAEWKLRSDVVSTHSDQPSFIIQWTAAGDLFKVLSAGRTCYFITTTIMGNNLYNLLGSKKQLHLTEVSEIYLLESIWLFIFLYLFLLATKFDA